MVDKKQIFLMSSLLTLGFSVMFLGVFLGDIVFFTIGGLYYALGLCYFILTSQFDLIK